MIDHVGDVGDFVVLPFEHLDFVEDAEHLIGIDRAEGQVVVGVAAIVEVESAHHVVMKEPCDDLLDVLCLVVMSGIDEDERLRTGVFCEEVGHAPVGDVGVIEGGLKGFVFDEQALIGF